jgi:hypothetical protein
MRRITISLPDGVAAALTREARRRRVSVSALCRAIIAERLAPADRGRRLPFVALGRSGHTTTARDIEAILDAEWAGDRRR